MRISRQLTTFAGTAIVVSLLASVGVTSAAASPTSAEQPTSPETVFDAAQEAAGLVSEDANVLDPGVAVSDEADSTVVSLGDFQVKITPESTETDTTVLPAGVRVMSLLASGETSTNFAVDLPEGTRLVPNDETGGFTILAEAEGTTLSLGEVHAPWAVDAEGNKLPTSYDLQGDTLTQRVDTATAAFPVVADPTITVGLAGATDGPGLYWNMTGAQAKVLASASATTVLGALALGCAAAGKVPRIGGYLKGVCGFIGAPTLSKVFSTIQRIMKNTKIDANSCYQIKVPTGTGLKKTSKSNCA